VIINNGWHYLLWIGGVRLIARISKQRRGPSSHHGHRSEQGLPTHIATRALGLTSGQQHKSQVHQVIAQSQTPRNPHEIKISDQVIFKRRPSSCPIAIIRPSLLHRSPYVPIFFTPHILYPTCILCLPLGSDLVIEALPHRFSRRLSAIQHPAKQINPKMQGANVL
jgi:hypothetical protein